MKSKIPITLLCSAALAFACGPRPRNDAVARDEPARAVRVDPDAPLAASLDVRAEEARVRFAFAVRNAGKKKLEVNFADGRTHDLVVLDSLGREVWRWSEGRLFTQAMQNRVLRTTDALQYEETWEAPAPGRYVVLATLESENFPLRERAEFVITGM